MDVVHKKDRGWLFKSVLSAVSLAVALGLCEGILRTYFADRLVVHEEERALLYRYDHKLGWFPRENGTYRFTGSKAITVNHNSRGLRDREHLAGEKPVMLVLGDSFVWGYDVEADDRFTEKLQVRMPEWDIVNMGVSGYSTDQELLLLMDEYDYYKPKIVMLLFTSDNDDRDNASNNVGNGAYYKPYFDVDHGLVLRGVPVPSSLSYFARRHPVLARSYVVRLVVQVLAAPLITAASPTTAIIRRMKEYVAERGGTLVVGLVEMHIPVQYFLQSNGIPYVQLDGADKYPTHGQHWTPEGHTAVSEVIYDFLQKQPFLRPAKEIRH